MVTKTCGLNRKGYVVITTHHMFLLRPCADVVNVDFNIRLESCDSVSWVKCNQS